MQSDDTQNALNLARRFLYAVFQRTLHGEYIYMLIDNTLLSGPSEPVYRSLVDYEPMRDAGLHDIEPAIAGPVSQGVDAEKVVSDLLARNCMVLFSSSRRLHDLKRHFMKFIKVRIENDQIVYFRFYDPRVLRAFLPSCSPEQAEEFYGPVRAFFLEGEGREELLAFSRSTRELRMERICLAQVAYSDDCGQ